MTDRREGRGAYTGSGRGRSDSGGADLTCKERKVANTGGHLSRRSLCGPRPFPSRAHQKVHVQSAASAEYEMKLQRSQPWQRRMQSSFARCCVWLGLVDHDPLYPFSQSPGESAVVQKPQTGRRRTSRAAVLSGGTLLMCDVDMCVGLLCAWCHELCVRAASGRARAARPRRAEKSNARRQLWWSREKWS